MDAKAITSFKIYPFAGQPIAFKTSAPIVEAFLTSVTDFHSSSSSAGSIASLDHSWLIEILIQEEMIQMSCSILSGKDHVVFGYIGKFRPTSALYYGHFQSQQLFQWYQKYSHVWLNPDGNQ